VVVRVADEKGEWHVKELIFDGPVQLQREAGRVVLRLGDLRIRMATGPDGDDGYEIF
jgi:hypothetical protein